MKKFIAIFLLIINVVFASNSKNDEIERKVNELLAKMTLQEKIGQMQQLNFEGIDNVRDEIKAGNVGSFLNAVDAETITTLQKIAVEESRLGIPIIFARDVIHGQYTIFPIPLGQAASWNPELIEKAAHWSAVEATATGIKWTFAPMIDIARDPRWGRIAESLGEDAYLSSVLGAAMVKGFQGDDLFAPNSMAACAKHYVGYGAAEGGRDYNTTLIPERQLRDIYLKPFEAAKDANALTFMSAFNDINGIPASGNKFTLRTILRDEWNYDGMVVSDWASMPEMKVHGYCADDREVAQKSITAGVDMEMVSRCYQNYLEDLLDKNEIDIALIDESVKNILRLKFRMGLFENPYTADPDSKTKHAAEHLKTAEELAEESFVLLKNEKDILPLKDDVKSVAIIGPLANRPYDQNGCWVFDGFGEGSVTPLKAFQDKYSDKLDIKFASGLETSRDTKTNGFDEAVKAAEESDVVLLFLGEEAILSGEAHSRAFLNLPGIQEELIEKISQTGKKIITIILAGRPLTFDKVANLSDAIIYAWHPGTMGGPAIADILMGKVVPSGKLPVTFPRTVGQIPTYYAHHNTGRPAHELNRGVPMGTPLDPQGYVSNYLDVDVTPAYPFGYGLSYTKFEYSDLKADSDELKIDGSLTVECKVKNTGEYEADEIVQLYIRDLSASVVQPIKLLKDFTRVTIKPGETKNIVFTLDSKDLAFHNEDMQLVEEPGQFTLWVGSSSEDLLETSFNLVK